MPKVLSASPAEHDPHLDRNLYQSGLVPDHYPDALPYLDPHTAITWTADNPVSEAVFHGLDNDCLRGQLPLQRVEELRATPQYRHDFAALAADHGYDVDHATPGAQACYGPDGHLVETGPHQGTWDYASPEAHGQTWEHLHMDVLPDVHADNYSDISQGVGDHGSGDSGAHDATTDSDHGAEAGGHADVSGGSFQ